MTTPRSALSHTVLFEIVNGTDAIRRHVRSSFPRLCESHVEDAVSAVMLAAVERPVSFETARFQSEARLLGLCKVIAWRHARGIVRRRSYHSEQATDQLDVFAKAMPGQEAWMQLLELDKHIHAACCAVSLRNAERLADALRYRVTTGDTDTNTAEKFSVRREYINRARHHLYDAAA